MVDLLLHVESCVIVKKNLIGRGPKMKDLLQLLHHAQRPVVRFDNDRAGTKQQLITLPVTAFLICHAVSQIEL